MKEALCTGCPKFFEPDRVVFEKILFLKISCNSLIYKDIRKIVNNFFLSSFFSSRSNYGLKVQMTLLETSSLRYLVIELNLGHPVHLTKSVRFLTPFQFFVVLLLNSLCLIKLHYRIYLSKLLKIEIKNSVIFKLIHTRNS